MDLFTPVVSEKRQHPHFRYLTLSNFGNPEIKIIKNWAEGFIDRDNKFVKEFQTTFNSSFWELYLYACFKELNCTVNFSYETPDFVINSPYGEFNAEATIANPPDGFCPEWDKNIHDLEEIQIEEIIRLSVIRLSNAIQSKHITYTKNYSKLSYVKDKPF